jgi:NADH:ubiquinone oxidoreductase subunit 6 (subunit J)
MKEILAGTDILMLIGAIVSIVVLIAMMIDLASGWQKAKQRDEAHNSYALSRTLNKFLLYEGGVIIALGIDLLLHLAHFWSLLGIDLLASVPVVAILIGIYLCVVEWLSLCEKADEKQRKHFAQVESAAIKLLSKEELVEALAQAIVNANMKDNERI